MHIETLKTFCDLVETGSFSKAAVLNFISQSAVSQQIKSLEQRFGQQLIERSQRNKVTSTEAGKLLYGEFKEIVLRFKAIESRLNAKSDIMTGTIRVATVYSIGLHEVPPYIKTFIKEHPQVRVHIEYSRTDKVYEACLNNTIDFGIVAVPLRKPNIAVIPLREDKLVIVCNPEHKLASYKRINMSQLNGEEFVAFERDIPTRKTIDQILKQHKVAVNYVMEFDNIETIKRSVEVGVGLSILPETAVVNEVRTGLLTAHDFSEGAFARSIGIIHRKGKAFSPPAREFINLLVASASDR